MFRPKSVHTHIFFACFEVCCNSFIERNLRLKNYQILVEGKQHFTSKKMQKLLSTIHKYWFWYELNDKRIWETNPKIGCTIASHMQSVTYQWKENGLHLNWFFIICCSIMVYFFLRSMKKPKNDLIYGLWYIILFKNKKKKRPFHIGTPRLHIICFGYIYLYYFYMYIKSWVLYF